MPARTAAAAKSSNTANARSTYASSGNRAAASSAPTYQVYSPGFAHVLTVRAADIRQMPPSAMNVTRLVLCANYDAGAPDTSCAMGARCKFVHADTRAARKQSIHVNYAWRCADDVTYERFPAGESLDVAPPNSKVATDAMDSHMALKTKALGSKRRPLSHCAHFYFNRACNLGADCQFVHAIFIDPAAKPHQRAPVPSQLGEGRELQLSKKQRESRQRDARDAMMTRTPHAAHEADGDVAAAVEDHSFPASDDSSAVAAVAAPLRGGALPSADSLAVSSASSSASSGMATPRSDASVAALPSPCAASVCGTARAPSARFRHDPYSAVSSRVVIFA